MVHAHAQSLATAQKVNFKQRAIAMGERDPFDVARRGPPEELSALLSLGMDPNSTRQGQRSLLSEAASGGALGCVKECGVLFTA